MILPSKELLSTVFGEKVVFIVLNRTILEYEVPETGFNKAINIYELMHMMKEWAYKQHNVFTSSIEHDEYPAICSTNYSSRGDAFKDANKTFAGDSEFEAVTAACEWIRDNL